MPELLESAFFPSRQSEQLERKNLILDVDEATGAPRLTTFDLFSSQPRNGLFVGNNPVNESDPSGLGNKLDGSQSDGTGKYIPLGSHIPIPYGASVYSAANLPSGYSSTNGWGSVSGPAGPISPGNIPVRRATDVNGRYADGSLSFPATPLGQILTGVGNAIGLILNIPNDVVGLALGVAGLPFGGEHWNFDHGGIEITGNKLVPSGAITFGDVRNYGPNLNPGSIARDNNIAWQHEAWGHSPQGRILGPLYIPANIIGGLIGVISGGDWHAPGNFMEAGPQQHPPVPFPGW